MLLENLAHSGREDGILSAGDSLKFAVRGQKSAFALEQNHRWARSERAEKSAEGIPKNF